MEALENVVCAAEDSEDDNEWESRNAWRVFGPPGKRNGAHGTDEQITEIPIQILADAQKFSPTPPTTIRAEHSTNHQRTAATTTKSPDARAQQITPGPRPTRQQLQ
jgi:hypothetical protein